MKLSQLYTVVTVVCLTLIASCLSSWAAEEAIEDAVKQRVIELNKAQAENRREDVYNMFCASYKKQIPLNSFLRYRPSIGPEKYTIEKMIVSEDSKHVKVLIRGNLIGQQAVQIDNAITVQEWNYEKDNWYLYVKTMQELFAPSSAKKQ